MNWANLSRHYDPGQFHYNALPEVKWIVERLDMPCGVLDVGCLDSGLLKLLSDYWPDVTGIDIRQNSGGSTGCGKFIHGDILHHSFDRQFDAIVFLSTVEHIGLEVYGNVNLEPAGDRLAVRAAARWLGPKGHILLTVPFDSSGEGRYRRGVRWERRYNHDTAMSRLKPESCHVLEYLEDHRNRIICMELTHGA